MALTQADLNGRVLRYLKVSEGNEAGSAEDAATVDLHINSVHDELIERQIAYWELTAIPLAVVTGLVRMVGADAAIEFMDTGEAGQYEARRMMGERMIRAVIARPDDHTPVPHHYF